MGPIEGKEEERANERTLEKKRRLKGEAARKSEEMLERRMEGHRACSRTVAHLQISFSPLPLSYESLSRLYFNLD